MARLICLAVGYLCGLFQTAYIYGKSKGIDIREKGSGNAGTTNTLRTFGLKAGILVLFGDILKCAAACLIARYVIAPKMAPELNYLLVLYAAAGAILGHNFPFYMHFKGGKGIAATAGYMSEASADRAVSHGPSPRPPRKYSSLDELERRA